MKNKISTTKKNITAYLALCFLITYITWGSIAVYSQLYNVNFTEYAWMYVLYIIGVLSPAISATIIQCKLNHYTLKQNISYIFKKPNNKIDWFICLLLSFLFSSLYFYGWRKIRFNYKYIYINPNVLHYRWFRRSGVERLFIRKHLI